MTVEAFITICLSTWAIRELVLGTLVWRHRRAYQRAFREEHARRHFAEARLELMRLASSGSLSPESATFRVFYLFNTHLMRHTDNHGTMSHELRKLLMRPEIDEANAVAQEAKDWSPEVKQAIHASSVAVGLLVLQYSWALRALCRLETWFGALTRTAGILHLATRFQGWTVDQLEDLRRWLEAREARRVPAIKDIRDTQRSLGELCAA